MLLPDPQRRGEIHFHVAKTLPYETRLLVMLSLLAIGLVTQALALSYGSGLIVFVGAAFLLAAVLFSLAKGYTNKPADLKGSREWRGADRESFAKIVSISAKVRSWDQSALDITCPLGGFSCVLAGGVVLGVTMDLKASGHEMLALVWWLDATVLLVPHWVTGVRTVVKNAPLTIKVQQLLKIMAVWQATARADEKMLPEMEVLCTAEGQVPQDAKLVLQMNRLGPEFLGLQTQVVINNVQGSDFPYLYCVLVAQPKLRLHQQLQTEPSAGLVAERKRQGDVDILIIRQNTTKTSGYHTDFAGALRIFGYALSEARLLRPAAG
jgi:hypothetical protein